MKKAVLHGDQESNPSNSDVAILYLAKEVDLTTYTPVCLASSKDTTAFDGKIALAVGESTLCNDKLRSDREHWGGRKDREG